MSLFRKLPVTVDAVQWTGDNWPEMLDFVVAQGGACYTFKWYEEDEDSETSLMIQTLEGEMRADPGDWIIRGTQGEFYPCKPNIFAETYEAVKW